MHNQPKYRPLRGADFFGDARSARPQVDGTVARGDLNDDELASTGKIGGKPVDLFPFAVTPEVMARGRERFDVFCSPCHGRTGLGNGMIVRRGYRQPPSYAIDRLRAAPAGYFFDVITNGFGAMPDYRTQVPVSDRWAIVAYVRALQLSAHATPEDVPPSERAKLGAGGAR